MPTLLPIQSVAHHLDGLSICELLCAANGSFRFAEMSIDDDLVAESFIEALPHIPDRANELEYFREEYQACLREASIFYFDKIRDEQNLISQRLESHYPFVFDHDQIILRDDISPIGIMYLWLRAYLLSRSKFNYLQFSDDELSQFNNAFEGIFEHIAALVVSADGVGEPWLTAKNGSAEQLLVVLNDLVDTLQQGRVKTIDQLSVTQRTTKDGRVDAIVVSMRDGTFRAESAITLVQATVQKSNLKNKTVTDVHIRFFDSFFLNPLTGAKSGALVVPHTYNDLHEDECKNANCRYFDIGAVFRNLGRVVLTGRNAVIANIAVENFNRPTARFKFSE